MIANVVGGVLASLLIVYLFRVTMSLKSGLDVDGQVVANAPVASQEAIKELGTNGGGVLNANSAHPFENPNVWSNLVEIFLLLLIPVSLTRTFGQLVGNRRQGYVLLSVMGLIWTAMLAVIWAAEVNGLRLLEGKELRFGVPASALFANATTGTSTGAVNAMHDSFTGLGGGGALLNMLFGEMTPGGVGTGLYSILVMCR